MVQKHQECVVTFIHHHKKWSDIYSTIESIQNFFANCSYLRSNSLSGMACQSQSDHLSWYGGNYLPLYNIQWRGLGVSRNQIRSV